MLKTEKTLVILFSKQFFNSESACGLYKVLFLPSQGQFGSLHIGAIL